MKDRESTNILTSGDGVGAVRYGIYDENSTLLRYEYIKLEDEPSVAGSIYNKANVLPGSVTDVLGISDTSEPKDAFLALRNKIYEKKLTTFERFMMGGML